MGDNRQYYPPQAGRAYQPPTRPPPGQGQYNDNRAPRHTGGAGYGQRRQRGGVTQNEFEAEVQGWFTGPNAVRWMIAVNVVLVGLIIVGFVGAVYFFTTISATDRLHDVTEGFHTKNHRLFIRRNMVNVYNHTTLGLSVLQGGQLIGSPTIPGSGYLIVNKRSLEQSVAHAEEVPLDDAVEFIQEYDEEHDLFWDPHGELAHNMRKREVMAYHPASRYSGITFRDQSNITMNGGDIVGVNDIFARHIYVQDNETIGSTANLQVGMAVGSLINGSLGVGFAASPVAGDPLVNQLFNLNAGGNNAFSSARFNNEKFVMLYQPTSGDQLLSIVGTVDTNNVATYSATGVILDTGVLGTDMQSCSLEAADGTGANVLLVVYRSVIDSNLYARVCDLTVPAVPVCGPSTNVTAGDLGLNGVLVFNGATNIRLNSITCLVHPDDGASTTMRWFVLGATDNNSGIMMAQKTNANVATALPVTIPRTPTVIVGDVDNLTDVSTSADLANGGKSVMQVDRLTFGYFVIAWRTDANKTNGKVEVNYINTTGPAIQLTTRSPDLWTSSYDNSDNAAMTFDISVSQAQSLLVTQIQMVYVGFSIGQSDFAHMWVGILAVPVAAADAFPTTPWLATQTVEFANDINPQATLSFPQSATFSVESMCLNQVLVSYASGGTGVRQYGYTVLLNVFPSIPCELNNGCVSVSTRTPFTNTVPYYARTMWRTLASDGFTCDGSDFTQFVTAFTIYDDFAYVNTSIYSAQGVAGEYTVSYGAFDKPRQVTGIATALYANQSLVTVQTGGTVSVCRWPNTIDGYSCPFEAPSPVYACSAGYLTFSPYCTSSNLRSPGQYIGYTNIWGDLQIGAPAAVAG